MYRRLNSVRYDGSFERFLPPGDASMDDVDRSGILVVAVGSNGLRSRVGVY